MQLRTCSEVYALLESGHISVTQALKYLREIELRSQAQGAEPERTTPPSGNGSPLPTPTLEEVLLELNSLIGLGDIKTLVREMQAFIHIQKRRQEERLVTEPLVLHMIFKGKPLSVSVNCQSSVKMPQPPARLVRMITLHLTLHGQLPRLRL